MTDSNERPEPDGVLITLDRGERFASFERAAISLEHFIEHYPEPGNIKSSKPLFSAETIQAEIEKADSLEDVEEVFSGDE